MADAPNSDTRIDRRDLMKKGAVGAAAGAGLWVAPKVGMVAAGAVAPSGLPTDCHPFNLNTETPPQASPVGATSWCAPGPLDRTSSDQAKAACEAWYGAPCYLETADCAGLGWGPRPAGNYVCGETYFGFQNGCSGDDGRMWSICSSYTTYGYWAEPGAIVNAAGEGGSTII